MCCLGRMDVLEKKRGTSECESKQGKEEWREEGEGRGRNHVLP